MALIATLVEQGHNRLRYLLTCESTGSSTCTITTTGAVTPDLKTDALAGPIKQIALAFVNGLGILAAGAKTQAQSRAMWMADNSDAVLGNGKVPRVLPVVTPRSGTANWIVDADQSAGNPTVVVTVNATGTAYLDIQTQGGIGI